MSDILGLRKETKENAIANLLTAVFSMACHGICLWKLTHNGWAVWLGIMVLGTLDEIGKK